MAKKSKSGAVSSSSRAKNVTLRKANNGFVISSYDDKNGGEKIFIAKTKKEADKYATKLLK